MSRIVISDTDLDNFAVVPVSIEPDTIELSHSIFLVMVAELRERRALDEHRRKSDEELIARRQADLSDEERQIVERLKALVDDAWSRGLTVAAIYGLPEPKRTKVDAVHALLDRLLSRGEDGR